MAAAALWRLASRRLSSSSSTVAAAATTKKKTGGGGRFVHHINNSGSSSSSSSSSGGGSGSAAGRAGHGIILYRPCPFPFVMYYNSLSYSRHIDRRFVTYMPRPGDGAPRTVTLIPGDGIGPLVTGAVVDVMTAMHAPLEFEVFEVSGKMHKVPEEVMDSIRRNKVCIKGGLATPVGGGVSSLNVQLRKELDIFASLAHCFNLPGLPTRHTNVDIVVIRENTEGEYSGLEHEVVPGVVESLKVTFQLQSSFAFLQSNPVNSKQETFRGRHRNGLGNSQL